jgi:hypothetical protein
VSSTGTQLDDQAWTGGTDFGHKKAIEKPGVL